MKHLDPKDQRGFTLVGLVFALVIVALAALVVWLAFIKDDKPRTASASVQAAVNNAKCNYADKDICKLFAAHHAQTNYTASSTTVTNGKKTVSTLKNESTEKYSLQVDGDMPYELIGVGTTTYTKAADGTWYKQTVSPDQASSHKARADFIYKEPGTEGSKVTYQRVGKERCGGLECFKYEIKNPDDRTAKAFIWFDDADYRLRRMQVSAAGSTQNTTFGYNRVSIKEPPMAQVKGLQTGQTFTPGQASPSVLPATGG